MTDPATVPAEPPPPAPCAKPTVQVWSLVAGVAALAAAIVRFVLGAADIADPEIAPILLIVWHSLTYAFALMGAALVASARASREVAVAIAMLSTAFFGGVVAIMAVTAGAQIGDPLAYYPIFVLAGVAALSALAAARA